MQCIHCDSSNVVKKGLNTRVTGETLQRYKCGDCGKNFNIPANDAAPKAISSTPKPNSIYVITSAQNNTPVNADFLGALETYCAHRGATLYVLPVKFRLPVSSEGEVISYPQEIQEYLITDNIRLHPKLRMLGNLSILSTTENPLAGISPLTKGDSLVLGHNQLQMTSLPVQNDDHPVIITTTGTVSTKNYSETMAGHKAEFNHSYSAVVVELDGEVFHLRHLNFDGCGFYDFAEYYTVDDVEVHTLPTEAIVTGDEHAIFIDQQVNDATYGKGGIVDTLKPRYIVRHDILDCASISHHDRNNTIHKFTKYVAGTNILEEELEKTVNHLVDTTPSTCTNIIVPSNHTDHLTRWLNETDIKYEPWNAVIYHWFMFSILSEIERNPNIEQPEPFVLYSKPRLDDANCSTQFLTRNETYKISDVEIAIHGDVGANGSKGSRAQFSKLPSKNIIGHSHSPGIEKGTYQVGTSTARLSYNKGPSSWMNTHCIIYANGKRQLVNIIKGKWRV